MKFHNFFFVLGAGDTILFIPFFHIFSILCIVNVYSAYMQLGMARHVWLELSRYSILKCVCIINNRNHIKLYVIICVSANVWDSTLCATH